jgi:hypothetical protein
LDYFQVALPFLYSSRQKQLILCNLVPFLVNKIAVVPELNQAL